MRLSDKRRSALYAAISDPIMDVRVEIQGNKWDTPQYEIDGALFRATLDIHKRIIEALNLEEAT